MSRRPTSTKARASTGALRMPALHESVTSSGLKVVVAERGPLPLVSVRLTLRAGSAFDPADRHGLADFTARLLRRGTAKRSVEQVDEAVEFVGASLGAAVGEDSFSVYLTTPAEHFSEMLQVMGEVVREPAFPEGEVALLRERTLAQLANDLDDPSTLADRAFTRALWGDHPYGHDPGGSAAHVQRITRDDVVRFHRERLGPKVGLLVIVGAVDPRRATEDAERAFGAWSGGPEAPPEVPELTPPVRQGRVLLVDKPDQTQSQIRLGGPGFRLGHADYFPATAMNIALGGGFTSRLVDEIRVNRGLTYGVSSYFDAQRAGGAFAVSSFTKTASTRELIDVALEQVGRVRQKGISAKELAHGQQYLAGLYPLRTETNESIAASITDMRLNALGDDWVEKFRDRLRAVTVKQAAEAARRYCFADAPAVVVLGKADAVRKLVKGLGPVDVLPATELE